MRLVNGILGVGVTLLVGGTGWTVAATRSEPYAHQRVTVREGRIWLEADGEPRQLDDVAAFCIECHGPGTPGGESHLIGPQESSHPTGVDYPAEHPEYRAIEELDSRILLADGRVTCFSCHAYDAPDHRPVLPAEGGHLCQACHLL